jgi:subtilisin family serine protease
MECNITAVNAANILSSVVLNPDGSPVTVPVGVIDSGVDVNHPDLAASIWSTRFICLSASTEWGSIPAGTCIEKFAQNPANNNLPDPMPLHIHGTHVSGIIAGLGLVTPGAIGFSSAARIVPLVALEPSTSTDYFSDTATGSDVDIAAAIYQAKHAGIQVINMSLGSIGGSPLMQAALQDYVGAGIVIVAAGNQGLDQDQSGVSARSFPASIQGLPNMFVVGASTVSLNPKVAPFSNCGVGTVDFFAPGVSILSSVPAVGQNQPVALGNCSDPQSPTIPFKDTAAFEGLAYDCLSGTSQAVPVVTAAVVYVLAQYIAKYGVSGYSMNDVFQTVRSSFTVFPSLSCSKTSGAIDYAKISLGFN